MKTLKLTDEELRWLSRALRKYIDKFVECLDVIAPIYDEGYKETLDIVYRLVNLEMKL